MKTTETVGMVGLGNMGHPIALNLVAAGYRVVGYEVDAVSYTHLTLPTILRV